MDFKHFSLVNIESEKDGIVNGTWIQNHIGTLETASKAARDIEIANSNRIKVAVVEDLGYSYPNYCLRSGLKRLN